MADEVCPCCGRPFETKPRRKCAKCGGVILKGHKWRFNEESRAEHRNCKEPDSYKPEESKG